MPGLGRKYPEEIKGVSKPKADDHTDEYDELDLPVAPGVMVGDVIVTEGQDVDEAVLEAEIRRRLDQ